MEKKEGFENKVVIRLILGTCAAFIFCHIVTITNPVSRGLVEPWHMIIVDLAVTFGISIIMLLAQD